MFSVELAKLSMEIAIARKRTECEVLEFIASRSQKDHDIVMPMDITVVF